MTETMILQAQGSAVALTLASIELVVSCALTLYIVVYTNKPPRSTDRTTAVFFERCPRRQTQAEYDDRKLQSAPVQHHDRNVECNRTDRVTSAAITLCANSATPSAVNGNGADGGITALY
jgi:hypothetical protein